MDLQIGASCRTEAAIERGTAALGAALGDRFRYPSVAVKAAPL